MGTNKQATPTRPLHVSLLQPSKPTAVPKTMLPSGNGGSDHVAPQHPPSDQQPTPCVAQLPSPSNDKRPSSSCSPALQTHSPFCPPTCSPARRGPASFSIFTSYKPQRAMATNTEGTQTDTPPHCPSADDTLLLALSGVQKGLSAVHTSQLPSIAVATSQLLKTMGELREKSIAVPPDARNEGTQTDEGASEPRVGVADCDPQLVHLLCLMARLQDRAHAKGLT